MSEQQTTFDPPRAYELVWPKWYTPSNERKRCNINVVGGLHPFGLRLHPDESKRCKGCEHATPAGAGNKRFHKCAISKVTRSVATDLRLKWRACEKWKRAIPAHEKPDSWVLVENDEPVAVFHHRDRFEAQFRLSTRVKGDDRPLGDALVRVGSNYGQILVDIMLAKGVFDDD